jgi:hypothetical protein
MAGDASWYWVCGGGRRKTRQWWGPGRTNGTGFGLYHATVIHRGRQQSDSAFVQRCQVHKIRRVEHVPEADRHALKYRMRVAYSATEAADPRNLLFKLHAELVQSKSQRGRQSDRRPGGMPHCLRTALAAEIAANVFQHQLHRERFLDCRAHLPTGKTPGKAVIIISDGWDRRCYSRNLAGTEFTVTGTCRIHQPLNAAYRLRYAHNQAVLKISGECGVNWVWRPSQLSAEKRTSSIRTLELARDCACDNRTHP